MEYVILWFLILHIMWLIFLDLFVLTITKFILTTGYNEEYTPHEIQKLIFIRINVLPFLGRTGGFLLYQVMNLTLWPPALWGDLSALFGEITVMPVGDNEDDDLRISVDEEIGRY